jgi:cell cycle arrest protein BUB2
LKLLDRCLKIVDPELYAHLRSKNLSAEIYAFPCTLVFFAFVVYLTRGRSYPHPLCLHAAVGSSSSTMGLSSRVWRTSQCSLRHSPIAPHARRRYGVDKVNMTFTRYLATRPDEVFSPMRLLRNFPPLDALPVVGIAVTLVRDLPPELYDELVRHPYDTAGIIES